MKFRALALLLLAVPLLGGCWGYSATDNQLTGQIKRVASVTPILCGDRIDVDVSMGVMRNGMGSMSNQDIWLTVADPSLLDTLRRASVSGSIVTITYDTARFNVCWNNEELTGVTLTK